MNRLLLAALGFALALTPAAARANQCAAAKLDAVAKAASCLARARGEGDPGAGTPPDPAKLARCRRQARVAFAKAEAKPPCLDDRRRPGLESLVDTFVADVDTALSVGRAERLPGGEERATGKRRAAWSAPPREGAPPRTCRLDPAKVEACEDKLAAALREGRAEADVQHDRRRRRHPRPRRRLRRTTPTRSSRRRAAARASTAGPITR